MTWGDWIAIGALILSAISISYTFASNPRPIWEIERNKLYRDPARPHPTWDFAVKNRGKGTATQVHLKLISNGKTHTLDSVDSLPQGQGFAHQIQVSADHLQEMVNPLAQTAPYQIELHWRQGLNDGRKKRRTYFPPPLSPMPEGQK